MAAKILDGKALAKEIHAELAQEVEQFVAASSVTPCLAAELVGEDPASQVYVRNKERACGKVGIRSQLHRLPDTTSQSELLGLISELNRDRSVHGILVQLPLPDGLDDQPVLDAIDPLKDVDAFHPENVGLLSQGRPRYLPCTPHGVQRLLYRNEVKTSGKHLVVIGRSEIVGKPVASMFAQRNSLYGSDYANATVTICHSRTADLPSITRQADVLVAAIGIARYVTADMVKPGAAVIDVGINRTDDGLAGDVDYDAVSEVASSITPVPGGVGPLTVAMLLVNTLRAAQRQSSS